MKKKLCALALATMFATTATSAAAATDVNQSTTQKSAAPQSEQDSPYGQGVYTNLRAFFTPNDITLSFAVGYTKRFSNDVTVGGETEIARNLLVPKFVLGYMISDRHWISADVGFFNLWADDSILVFDLNYQYFITKNFFIRPSVLLTPNDFTPSVGFGVHF